MSLSKGRFCKFVFCALLALASISGAPLPPDKVEELLYSMNEPKIAHKQHDETENGENLIQRMLGGSGDATDGEGNPLS
jgi:hypothetical protein